MSRATLLARLPSLLLVLVLVAVVALGTASIDIGEHWDEGKLLWSVGKTAETGLFLPGWYNYPSFFYDVSVIVAAPQLAAGALSSLGDSSGLKASAADRVEYVRGHEFRMRLRSVFFALSMLAGIAVYLLVRRVSGSSWVALFSALLLVSSYEFAYHSRWIAPDALLAAAVAWALLAQHRVLVSDSVPRQTGWVVTAGVLAGICIGTKYPGGIVLPALVLSVSLSAGTQLDRRGKLGLVALGLFSAVLAFLLTTPAAMVDPLRVARDVLDEVRHYGSGHGGYSVSGGWDHLGRLLVYLGTVAMSKQAVLAVIAALLSLVGMGDLARRDVRTATWLLSLPVLYLLYMSSQRVMIVRNYLLLLPFIAVFAGLGLAALVKRVANRPMQIGVVAIAIAVVAFNLFYFTSSALEISGGRMPNRAATLEEWTGRSTDVQFMLSPAVRSLEGEARFPNTTRQLQQADRFVFLTSEVDDWTLFPANTRGAYRTVWSRGDEVNWDYYPSWMGHARVVDVSANDERMAPLIAHVLSKRPGAANTSRLWR